MEVKWKHNKFVFDYFLSFICFPTLKLVKLFIENNHQASFTILVSKKLQLS